jgi:hypothetical protein
MKTTVSRYDFERAFVDAGRKDQFSHEALGLLFDYLEEYEESTGEEIELDVVALCCDYCEDTWQSIARAFNIELDENEDEDEQKQQVQDFLEVETVVVGETEDGFVYACF